MGHSDGFIASSLEQEPCRDTNQPEVPWWRSSPGPSPKTVIAATFSVRTGCHQRGHSEPIVASWDTFASLVALHAWVDYLIHP
jgi:hypothetical protein